MRKLIEKNIVIASHNDDKIQEIRNLISPLGFSVKSSVELNLIVPEEIGNSFEDNAIIKALSATKSTGIPALADDSGLVIDALDGKPGIHSARWAETSDGKRDFYMAMHKVENALVAKGAIMAALRSAHFISVLCIAWPDGHVEKFFGKVEGTIVWPPRGQLGFGYDPIFQPQGYDCTFGEMTENEKNGLVTGKNLSTLGEERCISHRSRAFKLFIDECLCG
ncbi:MAG: non-canonical purine NTP pyrophosphatase [Candidatus Liberibacter europaeus]|uniref:dITP/XTP pyrophosphatase n=1 Tax=Candidatus Liberibacter europaeus TaxID=744859 RepID=A0A2T4VYM6_9HYPH|nr:non-canonical purine NTP pyrophosphatase [Candidatus Liberibacter europaeus]PTL86887.1 MAG: non-canonical purine NTP pyrophosphatase [Candidatus Liberibacter europaeus]